MVKNFEILSFSIDKWKIRNTNEFVCDIKVRHTKIEAKQRERE